MKVLEFHQVYVKLQKLSYALKYLAVKSMKSNQNIFKGNFTNSLTLSSE